MGARPGRAGAIVLGGLAAIAIVGFFTGVSQRRLPTGYRSAPEERPLQVTKTVEAPTNAQLASTAFGPNRTRQAAMFAAMTNNRPALTEDVVVPEGGREAALAARTSRRAYTGAPPTIPHSVADQQTSSACLACHLDGLRIGERTAKAMSHPRQRVSCTQCHAQGTGGPPIARPLPQAVADNTFEGSQPGGGGARAWPGAPPEIPHRTFMRERCDTCHGVLASGLATSHPYRQSCRQCHVHAADLNQQPRLVSLGTDGMPGRDEHPMTEGQRDGQDP